MNPYSFEMETDFPEVFGSIILPTGRVAVRAYGELCCYTMIHEDGCLEVLLTEKTYREIKSGVARFVFHTRGNASADRRLVRLGMIEIVAGS